MNYEPDWTLIALAAGASVGFLIGRKLGSSRPQVIRVHHPILQGLNANQKTVLACCVTAIICVAIYSFANRYSIASGGYVIDRMTGDLCRGKACEEDEN